MTLADTEIVVGWPQALVALAIVLGPQIGTWIATSRGNVSTRKVERTLTTHNGGSHVYDKLDRLQRSVDTLGGRVARLESKKARRR